MSNNMYSFNVTSYKKTPKGSTKREGIINLRKDQIQFKDGQWLINLGYGYSCGYGNVCREGADSALAGQTYRLFHQWMPHKGDIIVDCKSGRTFIVGDRSGFVVYTAPLMENGNIVALLKFEDYYKD